MMMSLVVHTVKSGVDQIGAALKSTGRIGIRQGYKREREREREQVILMRYDRQVSVFVVASIAQGGAYLTRLFLLHRTCNGIGIALHLPSRSALDSTRVPRAMDAALKAQIAKGSRLKSVQTVRGVFLPTCGGSQQRGWLTDLVHCRHLYQNDRYGNNNPASV